MRPVVRKLVVVLALTGTLLLFVTFSPVVPWFAARLAYQWTDSDGDVLIVLGGGTIEDGDTKVADVTSYWRSVYSANAWKSGHFQKVILTGNSTPEMRPFLLAQGVPEDAIIVEARSLSTRENALFTKQLLNLYPGKRVLLTSDFHMYRAARTFAKVGIEVIPRPIPDVLKRSGQWVSRWEAFWSLLGECGRLIYYRWNGWI